MFSRRGQDDSHGQGNTNTGYNNPNDPSYNTGTGQEESGRGPHSSSLLNKLDPRVDSKTGTSTSGTDNRPHDGGAFGNSGHQGTTGYGGNTGHHGGTGHGTIGHGTSGYGNTGHGNTGYGNTGSTNAGPHSSNLANKADPRVDSDLDRNNTRDSGYNTQHTTGFSPSSHGSSNTSGPHRSDLANKADPRIDSDNSRGNYGSNTGHTGNYGSNTGNYGGNTTSGPHNSNLANKADPRVDSDNSRGNYGTNTTGTGGYNNTTSNNPNHNNPESTTTSGPHSSNLMNKLDPRVDSDNSKTLDNQGTYPSNPSANRTMGQEITSHGHATGLPESALDGRHAKHTAGLGNATASATVSGGAVPEGTANASGPVAADAGTTASPAGQGRGAGHLPGHGQGQGQGGQGGMQGNIGRTY